MATSLARPLPPAAADRLVKVCGLLASDHAGESAAAASAATKILRDHRLTWSEFLAPIVTPQPPRSQRRPAPPPRHEPTGWRGDAAACLARADLLTAWERGFVAGLARFPRLSAKQTEILDQLVERVRAAGGTP